jgi:hypothetical protein
VHEAHGDLKGKCSGETPVVEIKEEEKKITICHYPPGNATNPQEISIAESAWPAHEAHGDLKGKCNPDQENKDKNKKGGEGEKDKSGDKKDTEGEKKDDSENGKKNDTETEKKITICHYPPGNKGKPQEIQIPESAWKAHEAHGDSKGKCN